MSHVLLRGTGRICSLLALLSLGACATTYQTPGAGANLGDLSKADEDIAQVMKREPAASFPAHLAIVRAQSPGYLAPGADCYGRGRYCVITARDPSTEEDVDRIGRLPMVAGVAPMGRMLMPQELGSIKDLRLAAAGLRADMLLVWSVDTRFNVDSTDIGPLSLISLGFAPNKKAYVTATASLALYDVRTGYVYGVSEASATEQQRATAWSTQDAIDASRRKAETEAFHGLMEQFETLWKKVVEDSVRRA